MERESEVFRAKLAEQVGRYNDVVTSMKKVCALNADLSPDERDLLSGGYRNIATAHRASWRTIQSIEKKDKRETEILEKIKELRLKVEAELEEISKDCIHLIDTCLIRPSISAEAAVFYNTIKGDHYRYLAEIKVGDEKENLAAQSLRAYEEAQVIAVSNLPVTHPVSLALALNFSVFLYEICNETEKACIMARDAYDQAIYERNTLNLEMPEKINAALQLLIDNFTIWSIDFPNEGDDR